MVFNPNVFLDKNNNFKYTLSNLQNRILTQSKQQSNNFIRGLSKMQISMNAILEYIEDNEELMQGLEEAMDELTEDELTEEERKIRARAVSESLRTRQTRQKDLVL